MPEIEQQTCSNTRPLLYSSGEQGEPDEPFEPFTVFIESKQSTYSVFKMLSHSFKGKFCYFFFMPCNDYQNYKIFSE